MQTVNLKQGSQEWHDFRANKFGASDAPAMLGISKFKTRNALLQEKAIGVLAKVDGYTQKLFDNGHRFEALARPIAEQIIGEELYPIVGFKENLSASFDGITLLEDICFEHKTLNDEIRQYQSIDDLPKYYKAQMEQQLYVSGASKCLFFASKWDNDELLEEKHFWYESDPDLRDEILLGWEQFEKDLDHFVYVPEKVEEISFSSENLEQLPALRIELSGSIVSTNLPAFKEYALKIISNINTDLQTDHDFTIAEKTVKWCKDVEDRLKITKEQALSQTSSIEETFKAIDFVSDEVRKVRLHLDKLVKQQKESIRIEHIQQTKNTYLDFLNQLQKEIRPILLSLADPNFAEAIKGLKTILSIKSHLDNALAAAKIEAKKYADHVKSNLSVFNTLAKDHQFLFSDLQQIIHKESEDLTLLIKSRIDLHKKNEAEKLAAEREKIRIEEQRKLELEKQKSSEKNQIKQEEVVLQEDKKISKSNAVIEQQDCISAFLRERDFGIESSRIRSILVEFVKFQKQFDAVLI